MRKIFAIAINDYRQTILTKTFLISLLLMPLVFGGMAVVQILTADVQDVTDRKFIVVDQTGRLYEEIAEAAEERNRYGVWKNDDDKTQKEPRFFPERYAGPMDDAAAVRLELSKRVRAEEVFAFVVIGPDALAAEPGGDQEVAYYSSAPSFRLLPTWLERTIHDKTTAIRTADAGIDRKTVHQLMRRMVFKRLGLTSETEEGEVKDAEEHNEAAGILFPMAALMLMFFAVNMGSPMTLNLVIEEKMNKIAEILVSAVRPFELMMGKLLAASLAGLTFAGVYLGGGLALMAATGGFEMVTPMLAIWFLPYLLIALLTFGSMWAAIGAACSEMKDTQNFAGLTAPVLFAPLLLMTPVLETPTSVFSQVVSLIPPLTPMLMTVRMAMEPAPLLWQVLFGLVTSGAFAAFCVWAAGRIFRVGLLAQGQAPSIRVLLRWIFKG